MYFSFCCVDVGSQEINTLETAIEPDPIPEPEQASELLTAESAQNMLPVETPPETSVPDIDPDFLSALGDAVEDIPIYGDKIHDSLAQRWTPILKKGLLQEVKTKLLKEYPVPDNCRLLKAPILNAEISAAVAEVVRNRDKSIQSKQDQLGQGIAAINKALTLLLLGDDKVQAIKILSDSCRILTDLHFTETQLRAKLISPCIQKSILSLIEDRNRDETLFGADLPDKIKSSKAIEKQGHQIVKSTVNKTTRQPPVAPVTRSHQENWRGPPRYSSSNRGGRGGLHRAVPAHYRRIATVTTPMTSRATTSSNQQKQRAPRQ